MDREPSVISVAQCFIHVSFRSNAYFLCVHAIFFFSSFVEWSFGVPLYDLNLPVGAREWGLYDSLSFVF